MKKFLHTSVALLCIFSLGTTAYAKTISEITDSINKDKGNLSAVNEQISDLEDEQDLLEEIISDLDAELINMMTSISLLEEDIEVLQAHIDETQLRYEEAEATESQQYEEMKVRIRFMYERGDDSYLSLFLQAESFSDMVNKADYIESLYEYDRQMLIKYQEMKEQVAALKQQLDEEMVQLEADKASLQDQQKELDVLLAQKKKESANYDAQIAKAKQQAAYYKTKIQQEEAELKKLQEAERKKNNAANGNYTVSQFDVSIIDNASGSDLGKKIAKYGCQFIGNPYVPGGTSLTNGADCSGFVYRIYKDFGYNVPRTSYELRSAGTAVEYSSAQPGDVVCYEGHVGIYVGGGYIVHASTQKTGIKISRATYRAILTVRRII